MRVLKEEDFQTMMVAHLMMEGLQIKMEVQVRILVMKEAPVKIHLVKEVLAKIHTDLVAIKDAQIPLKESDSKMVLTQTNFAIN